MRRIVKSNPPSAWIAIQKKCKKYNDLEKSDQGKKARVELRDALVNEQAGLCCYCCRKIHTSGESAANEHIKPRSDYPNDSMDYYNILASCKTQSTCTSKKANQYDSELFVSPLDEDCVSNFIFHPSGRVEAKTDRGEYTIDLLGLNDYELVEARKNCLNRLDGMPAKFIDEYTSGELGDVPAFADILEYFRTQDWFE